jgi:hypothetical protein
MRLLELVDRGGQRFTPGLHVLNDAALMDLVAEDAPTIVVAMHSRIEYVLNRILEERGIEYSVIAISSAAQRASELLGLKGRIDLVPLSSDTLLLARKKLREGKIVATSVDFTVREPGTLYHDKYVAESLFEFASERGAQLLYAHTSVSEDGNVVVRLSRPRIDEAQSSPRALANDFVDFVAALAAEPPHWKVGPWTLRTRSEIKQYDNFWVRRRGRAR